MLNCMDLDYKVRLYFKHIKNNRCKIRKITVVIQELLNKLYKQGHDDSAALIKSLENLLLPSSPQFNILISSYIITFWQIFVF